MRMLVTAGPTFEPLDNVRRLTNLSTGRLGTELANFLTARGHQVTLLIGEHATWPGERHAALQEVFTTTDDLRQRLQRHGKEKVDAVFHAAAVSDFSFGKIWLRSPAGELSEVKAGKISTRLGTLLAELLPTPKLIAELRQWFAKATLVGWKFEVDGDRANVIRQAQQQMIDCHTDAVVANGPAYGEGFGLVRAGGAAAHLSDTAHLFDALEKMPKSIKRISESKESANGDAFR